MLHSSSSATTPEPQDQVKRRLLLNDVIGQRAAVLELLASEDEALLVRRNPFLVLNLSLDIVDGIRRLHIEGDGLAGQRLHEDLHTSAEPQDQVKRRLLLNVVIGQRAAVFELLASEDEALLVRRNPFL